MRQAKLQCSCDGRGQEKRKKRKVGVKQSNTHTNRTRIRNGIALLMHGSKAKKRPYHPPPSPHAFTHPQTLSKALSMAFADTYSKACAIMIGAKIDLCP